MRHLKTIAVLGLAAVAAFARPAAADTIQYNATFSPSSSGATTFNFTATFQQWDPSTFAGATLNSATIYLTATVGGTFTFTATAASQNVYKDSRIAGDVTLGSLLEIFPSIYLASPNNAGTGVANIYQTLANAQVITPVAGGDLAGTTGNTGAITTGLSSFIGSGTFDEAGVGSASVNAHTDGNVTSSVSSNVNVSAYIVYDYTPALVPEPASMALLGTGLLGLGAMVRRRRRNG